jgi:hypothetical protein
MLTFLAPEGMEKSLRNTPLPQALKVRKWVTPAKVLKNIAPFRGVAEAQPESAPVQVATPHRCYFVFRINLG